MRTQVSSSFHIFTVLWQKDLAMAPNWNMSIVMQRTEKKSLGDDGPLTILNELQNIPVDDTLDWK